LFQAVELFLEQLVPKIEKLLEQAVFLKKVTVTPVTFLQLSPCKLLCRSMLEQIVMVRAIFEEKKCQESHGEVRYDFLYPSLITNRQKMLVE